MNTLERTAALHLSQQILCTSAGCDPPPVTHVNSGSQVYRVDFDSEWTGLRQCETAGGPWCVGVVAVIRVSGACLRSTCTSRDRVGWLPAQHQPPHPALACRHHYSQWLLLCSGSAAIDYSLRPSPCPTSGCCYVSGQRDHWPSANVHNLRLLCMQRWRLHDPNM